MGGFIKIANFLPNIPIATVTEHTIEGVTREIENPFCNGRIERTFYNGMNSRHYLKSKGN